MSASRPWFAESLSDYAKRVGLDMTAAHPIWDAGLRAAWEEMKRREKAAAERVERTLGISLDNAASEEITLVEGSGRS